MKNEAFAETGEQVRAGLADIGNKVKDFSGSVSETWRDTREELQRRARRIKTATEDGIEEARHQIKARPLTVVTAVATGAFLVGALTGWIVAKNRR